MSLAGTPERARELDTALARRRRMNVVIAYEPWWMSVSHWGLHLWPSAEGKPWVNL